MSEDIKSEFDKLLSGIEKRDLFVMMEDAGWQAFKKLHEEVTEDWTSQITNADYRSVGDDKTIKDLIHRQGMMRGVNLFIQYVEHKKLKYEKDLLTEKK